MARHGKSSSQRPKGQRAAFGSEGLRSVEGSGDAMRLLPVLVEASNDAAGGTERGVAEAASPKGEARRGTLFESMQEGLALCRMVFVEGQPQDFVYVAVNAAFESLTGLRDVVGKRVSEVIPGIRESDPQIFEIYGRVASGGAPERFEMYIKALQQWYSVSVFSPQEEHFVAVFDVITDRKRAEDDLRRSEAAYRGLVEYAPLGIYRSTAEGRFLTVNPALIRMLGYGWAEELLRLDIARDVYVDARQRASVLAEFERHDQAGTEMEWKRKDGSRITVRVNVRAIRDPVGGIECYEGLVEDVTQQRSLEAQFRQAQRLEAVGRLAGGVAHDFNNVLTAITGYSDLLLEDLDPSDPKRGDIEEIRTAAKRATVLTRQLLAFSRKQVLQTRVLNLNEVVQTLEKMLHRLIGEDVKLKLSLASDLGAVRADPGQLEQVVLNLAVNSRDAMPNGGRLTIETANIVLDEAYARDHAGATPGQCVMLAVSDTGIGMDAETRSHLFEPFFTTKELGKGTGLGLATVYGIVKQSGGYVWVYSEPGRGATFKIYLPRVQETVESQAPATIEQPAVGGRETVLLAEDDPSVREIVAQVLAQKGYRVLRAPDGQTAIEMARGQRGALHLLVTDLVMPGMTGRELAETLRAERPGLRVLYMSGYTDDAVVRHGVLEEGMPYLQKPFTPRALAAKVREVLDRS
jgi:PAS domain S-box-containing protein